MKIYYPAGDRTPGPAEPEADMLPSEPARQANLKNAEIDCLVTCMKTVLVHSEDGIFCGREISKTLL